MNSKSQNDQARLESLVRISRYEATSVSDLLDYAIKELVTLTRSKIGFIFSCHETTRQMTLNTWLETGGDAQIRMEHPAVLDLDQAGLWGEAVRQSRPVVINDPSDPELAKTHSPETGCPLTRYLSLPVFHQGSIVAVAGLANKKNAYTDMDVRRVALMMDSIWKMARHKEIEDAVTQSRQPLPNEAELERYRNFVENTADACFEFDLHGRAIFCNEATTRMLGYTREEYLNLKHTERYAKKAKADRVFAIFDELYRRNLPVQVFESDMLCKDGSEITMEISVSLIRDQEGNATGFRGIGRDITARKKSLVELERYRNFIENIGDGCFEIDMNGTVTYVNEIIEKRMGYRRGELIGASSLVYADANEPQRLFDTFKQIYETGEPATIEDFVVRDKDGATRYISMTVSLILDADGNRVGFRGTTRDITDRRKAEDSLRRSEEKYRSILENISEGYVEHDLAGNFIFVNDAACRITGYSPEEMTAMNYRRIVSQKTAENMFGVYNRIYSTGQPETLLDFEIIRKDGSPVLIELNAMLMRDAKDRPMGYRVVARDVTARRKAEEDLRQSEEKYRSILENISEGYFECDINGRIVFVNDSGCAMIGFDRETLFRTNYRQFTAPETAKKLQATFREVIETGEHSKMDDYEIIRADGTVRVQQLNVKLLRDARGEASGFRVVSRDITERKRAEESLRHNEEKYRSIMESIMEGYLEYDLAGNITFANDAACTMMGYAREALLSMNYGQVASAQTLKIFDQTTRDILATGAPRRLVDFEIIRKDGTRRIHQHNLSLIRDAEGKPAGIRAMGRDVTELKWAEEALRQSEERIRLLFRNIPVPTFVWKVQHDRYVLSEFNSAAFQFIGDKIIDALGKPAEQFFTGIPQIAADIAKCMNLKKNTENQFWYTFDDRSEKRYVIVKYAFAPPDSVLMHVNDITGQKRAEENLQFISIHDSLTGLFNRFYSDAEISRLAASRMRPVSVIIIDLNNLKKINDESGHAMGDLYIKNAANVLKQTFRPEDMIARIGGDEFLVLLPMVDENICVQAMERLNENIRLFNQDCEFPLSLSAGFATTQAGDNLLERIREADKRMYEDKAAFKAACETSPPQE